MGINIKDIFIGAALRFVSAFTAGLVFSLANIGVAGIEIVIGALIFWFVFPKLRLKPELWSIIIGWILASVCSYTGTLNQTGSIFGG